MVLLQAVQTILRAQAVLPSSDSSSWFRSMSAVVKFLIAAKRQSDATTLLNQVILGEVLWLLLGFGAGFVIVCVRCSAGPKYSMPNCEHGKFDDWSIASIREHRES